MELIVKIGADQAALQQTVGRMQQQFKNMNVSVPTGWDSASTGAAWQLAAMKQQDSQLEGILNNGAAKRLLGISMRGGMWATVIYGMKEMVDYASRNLSQDFWERAYGISDSIIAKAQVVYSKLRHSVQLLIREREMDQTSQEKSVLSNASVKGQSILLEQKLKEAKAAAAKADEDLAYAKANQKEAVIPAQDHSAREFADRQVKAAVYGLAAPLGLIGPARALLPWIRPKLVEQDNAAVMRAKLATETSEAERKSISANAKVREIEDAYKKTLEVLTKEATDAEREKAANQNRQTADSRFEADALAKVGLFAGSSLLMNPDFSIQQEQLVVLRQIESNQHRSDFA